MVTPIDNSVSYLLYHTKLFHQTAPTAWFVAYCCGEVDCAEPAGYIEQWTAKKSWQREPDRFNLILKNLQTRYPAVGLSFGYIGNVGAGYGTYDDLYWYYFTNVWDHRENRHFDNCHKYLVGRTPRKDEQATDGDLSNLTRTLERWINNTVLPDLGKPCTRTKGKQGW